MNDINYPGINGYIDFSKFETGFKPDIENLDSIVKLKTSFLDISLNKKFDCFYKYVENDELLILGQGKIINNQRNMNDTIIFPSELKPDVLSNFCRNVDGFFYLIIIDLKQKNAWIISDKLGMFKLYYSYLNFVLSFSNYPANLAKNSSERDEKGQIEFLLINYSVEKTIFKNISRTTSANIIVFNKNGIRKTKYYNAVDYLLELSRSEKFISLEDTALEFRKIINDYTRSNILITLTSGLDSRLLLAGLNNNYSKVKSFTFGVRDNQEVLIAKKISNNLGMHHTEILLNDNYKTFLTDNYFNFIRDSAFIDLNINRFHYLYVWKNLSEIFNDHTVLTGIGGNTFLRDGLSVSHQTNDLLFNLIYTNNKYETVKNYIKSKKILLDKFNIKTEFAEEYLNHLFRKIKDNDKYFNHFYIKINFGISNYFSTEMSCENLFMKTYSPFFDLRFIESLIKSGRSIFNYNFLNNKAYKITSHKTYAELIGILNKSLLNIKINRGYKPRLMLSKCGQYLTIVYYYLNKLIPHKNDLLYEEWNSGLKLNSDNRLSKQEKIKISVLNSL
jgi:hypothetical protein